MIPVNLNQSSRRGRGFTLIEILTAVAITTIIVFTLVSMFNTSAKALREANRQTDVWEAARATFGILKSAVGDVTVGTVTNRIVLFAKNPPSRVVLTSPPNIVEPLRMQDIYLLSKDENRWTVNVFMLGPEYQSDGKTNDVQVLYRFQTNYPAVVASGTVLDLDYPGIGDPNHAYSKALAALDTYLTDKSLGIEPVNSISALADGIVHLRLVAYAADGRAFTNNANLSAANSASINHYIDDDTLLFSGNDLPASVDLEMFVLAPDRLQEFRSQVGEAKKALYLQKHLDSLQLFRTRIPIQRDLLATQ